MKITSFSIKRPTTILMAIVTLLLFGLVSYTKLNMDMLPSMNLPMIMIMSQSQGMGPEEIERNITEPLESVLSTVSNMKSISSMSSEGSSSIMLQFEDGTDMDFASLEVREKIDMIKVALPEGTMDPMIMKMNPNMMPIINFGVSYKGYDIAKLTEWSNKNLKPTLERIDGVASVDVMGSVINEIKITVKPEELALKGLNINSIVMAIKGESSNLPIGTITEGNQELLVRTYSEIKSKEDVENILVNTQDGKAVKLKDVASIELATKETTTLGRINGEDSLILGIQKESNANTVKISKEINEALDKLEAENEEFGVIKVFDQGEVIEFALGSVKYNAVIGAILAIIILFLFLKDIRTTLIMAVAIPISAIATFTLVYFTGLTLNMISLGGIALGIGMLVDNSIVVIENIARLKKAGQSNVEAAINGTKEVAVAITASTLTSICVFLPIVFVQGVAADIFKEMALTVTFALLSSLAVSFTLVPLLASRLLNEKSFSKENKLVDKLRAVYKKALAWSLDHRKTVLLLLLLSIVIGVLSLGRVGMEFFPSSDQGTVSININTPKGSTMDYIIDVTNKVEEKLTGIEDVESIAVSINNSKSTIHLMLAEERDRSDKEVADNARELLKDFEGAKIEVGGSGGMMSGGTPIQISVVGDDFEDLDKITEDIAGLISKVNGVIDIKKSNEKNADEIRLVVDKEKAEAMGLSVASINNTIAAYFKSTKLTTVRIDGVDYELTVYPESSIAPTMDTLKDIVMVNSKGLPIPIEEVVNLTKSQGYSQIDRVDGSRKVTVSAGITGRSLGEITKDIEKELASYEVKDGYKVTFGGEVEQMKDAFAQMAVALVLAIALVYMVMAAQFESLINPFIIMFVVPLAFVGAILALTLANVTVSMPALIGFVMLTGIIVNNGIVLIDYMNRLKLDGVPTREAILEAGPVRLQPILMTTLTTVIGLVPMALGFGEGSELQMPLALTVIGGLTFGTILTLIIVPVLYSYTEGMKNRVKRKRA